MTNASERKDEGFWQYRIARNERILQSISEGVFVVDTDKRISFINDAAARQLKWAPADLLGQRYEKIVFNEADDVDSSSLSPVLFALTEGETTHVNADTFYCSDGDNVLVEYACVPLLENKKIIGVVITFQNISERRDLENAVAEARDAALESAQEKANFLANMSHEIRTPLNGIIGVSEFLGETDLNSAQRDYVETLRSSANLLLEIVNDILDFSKIEAGKLELEKISFNLHETISETIKLFFPEAFKKNISLLFEIEEDVPVNIYGDESRLRQILNNLLSNAIKFTSFGSVRLHVSLETKGVWRFDLIDSGIGIDSAKVSTIFEPFSQADITTTRRFGGTGLGLAICKQLVQMMDGKIGVISKPNEGSNFWFTANFGVQEYFLGSKVPSQKSDESVGIEFSKLRILIVEDNLVNQEVALGRLMQLGVAGEVAENGIQALKRLSEEEFDLILMDCRMPEMDGFEAAEQIKSIKTLEKKPKIIAMTASVTEEEVNKCFVSGMDDYLAKPITVQSLQRVLRKHFRSLNEPQSLDEEPNLVHHRLANILDTKALASFMEIESRGEKNFAEKMLALFLSHTESQLLELKEIFEARDFGGVKNKAHALRGSSANIGLKGFAERFWKLETTISTNIVEAEFILAEIYRDFFELKKKVSYLSEFGD